MDYHIWTFGCQMNTADSQRLASELERMGHHAAADPDEADILVVNTCVVRQSAEDKAMNRLLLLRGLKERHPDKVIGVMGCMVGVRDPLHLRKKLPYVDVFLPPSEPGPMVDFLKDRMDERELVAYEQASREQRDAIQDGDLILPVHEQQNLISAHVPVVYGCSHACSFCIIPFRRGVERSRSVGEIVAHVRSLALQGIKEITLLGQNVNAYHGIGPDGAVWSLARLIRELAAIDGLLRLRYTTSHPNDMGEDLIAAHGEVEKLMPYLHLPVQSGSDRILKAMNRKHTAEAYLRLIERLRAARPDLLLSGDFIVGFPGETEEDFEATMDLVRAVGYGQAYSFKYSARPGTPAAERAGVEMAVMDERLQRLQALLSEQQRARQQAMVGREVGVLIEKPGRLAGQMVGKSDHLHAVHLQAPEAAVGDLLRVRITASAPNSLAGTLL